jgi:hypothetical protein
MTIEEAEQSALNAASEGDLIALQAALQARRAAISEFSRKPLDTAAASEELVNWLTCAIATGNSLDQKLSALNVRLRTNAARIAAIQAACAGIEAPSRTSIDCRG